MNDKRVNGQQQEVMTLLQRASWEVDLKRLDGLRPEHTIASLGLDSVALMEVLGIIEDELSIHLPEEQLSEVRTVESLVQVVLDALRRGGA
jgi:acyl carrier protein